MFCVVIIQADSPEDAVMRAHRKRLNQLIQVVKSLLLGGQTEENRGRDGMRTPSEGSSGAQIRAGALT
jgi:hypothetical protein